MNDIWANRGSLIALERLEAPPRCTPEPVRRLAFNLPEWTRDALCAKPANAGMPWTYDRFVSGAGGVMFWMLDVCALCPVREACLEDALATETSTPTGIRGGLNAKDRRALYRARHKAANPPMPSWVYFARRSSDGLIKIGVSTKVDQRTKQVGAELIVTMQGDRWDEQEMHARFAASRVVGEWFRPTPDLNAFMGELLRQERAA